MLNMSQAQQFFGVKEAGSFPQRREGCDTWNYVVNKYALHVTGPFVLYPIVARFGHLIAFSSGRLSSVNQTRRLFAPSNP